MDVVRSWRRGQFHRAGGGVGHIEAAGASLADVVELMTFHTELQADMQAFARVKDQYFPDRYPSWTAVGTTELALPGLRVEIRAVAVAGCGAP